MAKSKSSGATAKTTAMSQPRVAVKSVSVGSNGKSVVPPKVEIGKPFNANDISRDDFKKILDTMPDGTIYSSREHFRTYSKENGEWIVTVGPEASVGRVPGKEQLADVRITRWGVTFYIPDAQKANAWRKKYKK